MDVAQSVQIGKGMPPPGGPRLDDLVLEYADNKTQADALTARNAEIAEQLAAAAAYKDGSNTGHVKAGGHKVTITRKFNTKWDAERLEKTRALLTDKLFFKVFKWKPGRPGVPVQCRCEIMERGRGCRQGRFL